MATIDPSQPVLELRINNKEPLALEDFAESLRAVSNEFREWLSENPAGAVTNDVKLYVRDLRSGSLIADLVSLTPVALPFVANANSVIDFAKHLKFGFDVLLNRSKCPAELPRHTYENLSAIVDPIAKDNASQLNVSTIINGDLHQHFHISSLEANAAQNAARRATGMMKQPATGRHQQVVMSVHQARNDLKSHVGDRAIIESIHPRPVKVVFASEQLKGVLLQSSENPFRGAYLVDVDVETVGGRPVLYKVVAIHDVIELPGDEAA